jgi:hypothetical protein
MVTAEGFKYDKIFAYCCVLLSRFAHVITCTVQKRALLKNASFDRYKSFRLSVSNLQIKSHPTTFLSFRVSHICLLKQIS